MVSEAAKGAPSNLMVRGFQTKPDLLFVLNMFETVGDDFLVFTPFSIGVRLPQKVSMERRLVISAVFPCTLQHKWVDHP